MNRLLPRVRAKIDVTETCWLWTAGTDRKGYGRVRFAGSNRLAHKVVYEALIGAVPDGLELDHICRNPLCVRPAHLEPVTHRENIRRGDSPYGKKARQTHCVKGHEFAGDNVYIRANGGRGCRTCANAYSAAARTKRRRRARLVREGVL